MGIKEWGLGLEGSVLYRIATTLPVLDERSRLCTTLLFPYEMMLTSQEGLCEVKT